MLIAKVECSYGVPKFKPSCLKSFTFTHVLLYFFLSMWKKSGDWVWIWLPRNSLLLTSWVSSVNYWTSWLVVDSQLETERLFPNWIQTFAGKGLAISKQDLYNNVISTSTAKLQYIFIRCILTTIVDSNPANVMFRKSQSFFCIY